MLVQGHEYSSKRTLYFLFGGPIGDHARTSMQESAASSDSLTRLTADII
jgi:hypothetical protein